MERVPCEFSLIRYVPDVVKGEFVNIGVLLREAGHQETRGGGRVAVRFTRDWRRVRCVDAEADIGLLEGMETEFRGRLERGTSTTDPKGLMEVLEDTLSNSVQVSEGRATLAEDLTAEMDLLMRMYVEPMRVARARRLSGRARLLSLMKDAFGETVWGVMSTQVRASEFAQRGNPLRIDCMYGARSEGEQVLRMYQAVSLESDTTMANSLVASVDALRQGVREGRPGWEPAELRLSAVVETMDAFEGDEEARERYEFAVSLMEKSSIRVLPPGRLAAAAETARRELRV